MSGSGISWAICKSAPRIRQTSTPAPHHSVFYRPDALPATQPTASKHWRSKQFTQMHNKHKIKSVVFLSKDHHPNTYRKPPARLPDSTASHSESRRFNSYAYPETAAYVSHTRTTPNIHCRCFYGASNQPYTAHASQDNSRTLSLAGVVLSASCNTVGWMPGRAHGIYNPTPKGFHDGNWQIENDYTWNILCYFIITATLGSKQ